MNRFIPRRLLAAVLMAASLLGAGAAPALAGTVADRVRPAARCKVCIWPDYYGITWRNPRTQQLTGIDIDLSAELGRGPEGQAAYGGLVVRHADRRPQPTAATWPCLPWACCRSACSS
jgi:ABC-type amino acid transport substrate-binding protein